MSTLNVPHAVRNTLTRTECCMCVRNARMNGQKRRSQRAPRTNALFVMPMGMYCRTETPLR
jgi:hypothetical protein